MNKHENNVREMLDNADLSGCEMTFVYGFDVKKLPLEYQIKAYKLAIREYKLRLENFGRPIFSHG